MPYTFPEESREVIDVTFGGYGRLEITVEDGEILVDDLIEEADGITYHDHMTDEDQLYWLGCAYWWYRMDGGDYWSCDDWWMAAMCCMILQNVPDCAYLKKVCGITATGKPYDYRQMRRAMDLVEFANRCNTDFREGAD